MRGPNSAISLSARQRSTSRNAASSAPLTRSGAPASTTVCASATFRIIVVGVTEDLVKRFNAVDLVKKGAEVLGGKGGGGRPDMAQAGGPDGAKADAALAAIEAALSG